MKWNEQPTAVCSEGHHRKKNCLPPPQTAGPEFECTSLISHTSQHGMEWVRFLHPTVNFPISGSDKGKRWVTQLEWPHFPANEVERDSFFYTLFILSWLVCGLKKVDALLMFKIYFMHPAVLNVFICCGVARSACWCITAATIGNETLNNDINNPVHVCNLSPGLEKVGTSPTEWDFQDTLSPSNLQRGTYFDSLIWNTRPLD